MHGLRTIVHGGLGEVATGTVRRKGDTDRAQSGPWRVAETRHERVLVSARSFVSAQSAAWEVE